MLEDTPYEYQAWPAWFYGPDGQAAQFAEQADVPKGWKDSPSKVKGNSSEEESIDL